MIAFAAVLAVLAAVRAGAHLGPRWLPPVTGPVAAAALVLTGLAAGLSPADLGLRGDPVAAAGWAAAGAGLVAAGYGVAAAVPALRRRAFAGTPYRLGARAAAYRALVAVPLATVLVEEVAFRGVLWALVARDHGQAAAVAATSVLFGLWHARPGRDRPLAVLGTVAFTTAAGLVFAALRVAGGSLLAPVAMHWAANGLGIALAAAVWRRTG